jgi:hypothetical protein
MSQLVFPFYRVERKRRSFIDYSFRYYFSKWWRHVSLMQKEIDGHRCSNGPHLCDRIELQVHHRKPDPYHQNRGREVFSRDVTTLCGSCHWRVTQAWRTLAEYDRRRVA